MPRKTAMLSGVAAVAIIASGGLATAAEADPIPPAAGYADLLEFVPNAQQRLNAADFAGAQARPAHLIKAQYWVPYGYPAYHHHHHHHHHHYRPRDRGAWGYGAPAYYYPGTWGWAPRPAYHHHHHQHHHHHHHAWGDGW